MSGVRLDRWLWAARFFKTRAQAKAAIEGGKIDFHQIPSFDQRIGYRVDRLDTRRARQLVRLPIPQSSKEVGSRSTLDLVGRLQVGQHRHIHSIWMFQAK